MYHRCKIFIYLVIFFLIFTVAINCTPQQPANLSKNEALKIELGKKLFFDNRLSFNNTKSCGSCHDPKFAYTDGYRKSITATGENVLHNSPSLINIAAQRYLDWANPTITTLEKQHERPLFNKQPIELGADIINLNLIATDPFYSKAFNKLYPGDTQSVSYKNIITAISSFVKSLQSLQSPYDYFVNGNKNAISSSAQNGMQLFFSKKLKCASCHPPPYFTMATQTNNIDSIYFNIGLYNILNFNKYPSTDKGLMSITKQQKDDGRFKTPSLRNVSLTAPYMHDGSVNSIEEVIENYARGGRNISYGPLVGDGKNNTNKDKRITGFIITQNEKKDLINFLFSLTDSTVLTNKVFQNPYN